MTTIARCATPYQVVRGVPDVLEFTETNPPAPDGNGGPIDLTGSTITAVAMVDQTISRTLTVTRTNNAAGKFAVPLPVALTVDLPPQGQDRDPRVVVTITDPQGKVRIYVMPLVSALP